MYNYHSNSYKFCIEKTSVVRGLRLYNRIHQKILYLICIEKTSVVRGLRQKIFVFCGILLFRIEKTSVVRGLRQMHVNSFSVLYPDTY